MDFVMPDDREDPRPDFRSACFELTQAQRSRVMAAMAFLLRGGPVLIRMGEGGKDKRQVYLDPEHNGGTFVLGEKVYGRPKPDQPASEMVVLGIDLSLHHFVHYVAFDMPEEDHVKLVAALVLDRQAPVERIDEGSLH